MALNAPQSVEIEQIQFKIHDTFEIFESCNNLINNINLLATSSTSGLVFVGIPFKEEIKAVQLKTLVEARENDGKLYARSFQIPSKPNCIATSCDGLYLAVNYTLNGSAFLAVYNVPSFYSKNVIQNFSIKISADDNVNVFQLLWNPIISNTLAIVMSDGAVGMYNFKENNYEFHTLEKSQQILCGCWSPKGKQIVFGFRNGKIVQFKPDLKPARTIECPANIVQGTFKTIAIQWLSTYQFAVSYLQDGEDMTPNLYIVNAPKAGQPTYINYYDICYSSSGPRNSQIFFIHIQQWNILLVANSNSMEAGILGTSEAGEAPNWTEYILNDSCRLNLPMTKNKLETYPIGLCLETGTTHHLVIGENEIPVMPIVHVLSTHGQLITFDFLNLSPNFPGICSPPHQIHDQSGMANFKEIVVPKTDIKPQNKTSAESNAFNITNKTNQNNQNFEGVTTTTAKPNFFMQTAPQTGFSLGGGSSQALFGSPLNSNTNSASTLFSMNQPKFGGGISLGSAQQQPPCNIDIANLERQKFAGFGSIKVAPVTSSSEKNTFLPTTTPIITTTTAINNNFDKNKPLYTVQSTFTPPKTEQFKDDKTEFKKNVVSSNDKINLKDPLNYDYIQDMIQTEIQCFELELRELSSKSKDINISIGNMENIRSYTKKLDEFQDVLSKAKENDFETDIQVLRHSINECFTMIAEVRSKLEFFENPELSRILLTPSNDQASRRQLARLNSMLTTNEAHLKIIKQQIDANWSDFQDLVHKNSSTRMHIPSLEGIYQTMTKQKNILTRERQKIAHIKSKLNFPGLQLKSLTSNKNDLNADSLADSILSMSLSEQISKENSKLNSEKLQAIREVLQNRKIINVKPQRPDRLQSEVILRSKIKTKKTELSKQKVEKTAQNISTQTIPETKGENDRLSSTLSKENANMRKQQPEISQSVTQPLNIKTQMPSTSSLFIPPVSNGKSLENNSNEVQFGKLGLNLAKSNVSVTDSKNSVSSTPLFISKSFGSTITPINNQFEPQTQEIKSPGLISNLSPTTTSPGLSFGNLSNTVASNLSFGNLTNKGSFTPVSSTTSFGGSTSGLAFNLKTATSSSNFTKTQASQSMASDTSTKPNFLFSAANQVSITAVSDSSQSNVAPLFSSGIELNTLIPTSSELQSSEKSFNKNIVSNSTESFIENLNICKPTLKTTSSTAVPNINIFGTAIFSSNSQNENTPNFSSAESKTNFLSSFSSMSKSPIFGSTPNESNTNASTTSSSQLSFGFGHNISTVGTTAGTISTSEINDNKSVFASITTLATTVSNEIPKSSVFNISKSPSIQSFGIPQISPNVQIGNQLVAKNEEETAEIIQQKPVDTGTTAANFIQKNTTTTLTTTATTSIFSNMSITSPNSIAPKISMPLFNSQTSSDSSLLKTQTSQITSESETMSGNKSSTPLAFTISNTTTTDTSTVPSFSSSSLVSTTLSNTTTTPITSTTFSFSSLSFGTSAFPSLGSISTNTTAPVSLTPTLSFGVPTSSTSSVNTSVTATATTTSSSSIFNISTTLNSQPTATNTTSINTGNIFSGIPKPDQSVFGQANSFGNIFAQAAQSSQFVQKPSSTSTTPSIFGGGNNNTFGGIQQPSTFGNPPSAANTNSVFGTTSEQKADSVQNIFGSPTNTATNSGSIFSRSPFSLSTGTADQENSTNIFGSSTAGNTTFSGSGSSIFGGGIQNANQTSPTSPFTGGSFTSGLAAGTGFGGFSINPTQNQTNVPFGQAESSISPTSFGSPNATLQKTTFGGPPSFGSPPAFGSSPTFGGGATFGSGVKGFGTFSTPTNTNQTGNLFGNPTQKNDYFEALGASNDGLSFGNLAQNANGNSSKPNFGAGSSFSNWR